MLQLRDVDVIVREVAQRHLASLGVQNVQSEPTTDSEGNDALRITITLQSAEGIAHSGGALLDTLTEMLDRLNEAKDPRFAIIDYVSEEELDTVDDPDS